MLHSTLNTFILIIVLGLFTLGVNAQVSAKTIYVDSSNIDGVKDGSSWATAYSSFENAIYYSDIAPGDTLLIAKGTYSPGLVGNSFYINIPLIKIYGGFPSGGGTFQNRDWEKDSTILLANGNSVIDFANTNMPIFDGFYLTGGSDTWGGGGVYNKADGATLRNLVIYNNNAEAGGGLFNDGNNIILDNIVFKNNSAIHQNGWSSGGAIFNNGDFTALTEVVFENNFSEGLNGNGATGGAIVSNGKGLTLKNIEFSENISHSEDGYSNGGALLNFGEHIYLKDVTFTKNLSSSSTMSTSGGAFQNEGKGVVMEDVTFIQNKAESINDRASGGGVYINTVSGNTVLLSNVFFKENEAIGATNAEAGGIHNNGGGNMIVRNVTFSNNKAIGGLSAHTGAMSCRADTLDIADVLFFQNQALSEESGAGVGGLAFEGGTVNSIFVGRNISFIGNEAKCINGGATAGAFQNSGLGTVNLSNCVFKNNLISGASGTITAAGVMNVGKDVTISNSVFYGNKIYAFDGAAYGGAALNAGNSLTLNNVTLVNNEVESLTGAAYGAGIANNANLHINNCLFYNNLASTDNDDVLNMGVMSVNNSFTQSDFSGSGVGNIQGVIDPFRDVTTPDGADGVLGTADDGLVLACQSLPIDAGDNALLNAEDMYDIAGLDRINGTVDMGAYEYHGDIQTIDSVEFCTPDTYTWNGETFTEAGTYTYVTGTNPDGCDIVDVLVLEKTNSLQINVNPQINNICINTGFTFISHQTTHVSEVEEVYGLPNGITAQYSNNAIVLTGVPTQAGEFNYVLNVKGCGEKWIVGRIEVLPVGEAVAISNDPLEICINNLFSDEIASTSNLDAIISYTGLPNGLEPILYNNTLYFNGSPTENGAFNYSVIFSGCENVEYQGSLTVVEDNSVQELNIDLLTCINTPFQDTTHQVTGDMTAIETVTGLPQGLTFSYDDNLLVLSGTPTEVGIFEYTIVPNEGCDDINGSIVIHGQADVDGATQYPTTCMNYGMSDIFHFIDYVSEIGTIEDLPNGVTVELLEDVIKISGTPTEVGTFNYSITLIGGCGEAEATGTIVVESQPTLTQDVETTTCYDVVMDNLIISGTGLTSYGGSSGLPLGLSAELVNGEIMISGTPTEFGVFPYEITANTDCDDIITNGTIFVTPNYKVTNESTVEETCIYTQITPITHTTDGVDAIASVIGLPSGVNPSLSNGVLVISGIPTEVGTFDYQISFDSQLCGDTTAHGQIIVKEALEVDLGGDLVFCEGEDINLTLDAGFGDSFIWNTGESTQTIEVSDAGLYSVTVHTNNGCSSMAAMEVIVNNSPTVNLTLIDDNTLKASAQYVDYQWMDCATESVISGANSSVFIPTENGSYAVVVTSQSGCENTSECIAVTTVNLKTEDWNKLVVYPNPTKDNITIDFGRKVDQAKISIQDLTGKVVSTETINNTQSYQTSLTHLAKGVYLVSIELKNKEKKVIKIIKD